MGTITGHFTKVDYDHNTIIAEVIVSDAIYHLSAHNFEITTASGNTLYDAKICLSKDTVNPLKYRVWITVPIGLRGSFGIRGIGKVIRDDTLVEDTLVVPYHFVEFSFIEPIHTFFAPRILQPGINDFFYHWHTPVSGLAVNDFQITGIDPGTPTLYRAASLDARPPAEIPVDTAHWKIVNDAHTEPAKYHLLRFDISEDRLPGTINIVIRDAAVLSVPTHPVSPVILGSENITVVQGEEETFEYKTFGSGVFPVSVTGLPSEASSDIDTYTTDITFFGGAGGAQDPVKQGTFDITAGSTIKTVNWRIEAQQSEIITAGGDAWQAGNDRWDFR